MKLLSIYAFISVALAYAAISFSKRLKVISIDSIRSKKTNVCSKHLVFYALKKVM